LSARKELINNGTFECEKINKVTVYKRMTIFQVTSYILQMPYKVEQCGRKETYLYQDRVKNSYPIRATWTHIPGGGKI